MGITDVDVVVNFIVLPISVALCKDVELDYHLLRLPCLSDIDV
jgi:hypothetical protein